MSLSLERYLLILLLAPIFILLSCKGDPVSPNGDDDSWKLPRISQAFPELAYFEDNKNKGGANFRRAADSILSFVSAANEELELAYLIFKKSNTLSPNFEGGKWGTEFTVNYNGQSTNIDVEVEEGTENQNTYWSFYITMESDEQEFDRYEYLRATLSQDNKKGGWDIMSLEHPNQLEFDFSWYESNDSKSVKLRHIKGAEFEGNRTRLDYSFNDTEHELILEYVKEENQSELEVKWSSNSEEGYFDLSSQMRKCWDANFQNRNCFSDNTQPEIPDLNFYRFDDSFFRENLEHAVDSNQHFKYAAESVLGSVSNDEHFIKRLNRANNALIKAQDADPAYNEDTFKWEWKYSYSPPLGGNYNILLTAWKVNEEEYEFELHLIDVSIESQKGNYLYLKSFSDSNVNYMDGTNGWELYPFYDREFDVSPEVILGYRDNEDGWVKLIDDYSLTFYKEIRELGMRTSYNEYVTWNPETNVGCAIGHTPVDVITNCWDENFEDVDSE